VVAEVEITEVEREATRTSTELAAEVEAAEETADAAQLEAVVECERAQRWATAYHDAVACLAELEQRTQAEAVQQADIADEVVEATRALAAEADWWRAEEGSRAEELRASQAEAEQLAAQLQGVREGYAELEAQLCGSEAELTTQLGALVVAEAEITEVETSLLRMESTVTLLRRAVAASASDAEAVEARRVADLSRAACEAEQLSHSEAAAWAQAQDAVEAQEAAERRLGAVEAGSQKKRCEDLHAALASARAAWATVDALRSQGRSDGADAAAAEELASQRAAVRAAEAQVARMERAATAKVAAMVAAWEAGCAEMAQAVRQAQRTQLEGLAREWAMRETALRLDAAIAG
jgi:hypothetical protein